MSFFDVDFAKIIDEKAKFIFSNSELKRAIHLSDDKKGEKTEFGYSIGPRLTLVSGDLRRGREILQRLLDAGFDPSQPTLITTECVLVCKCSHLKKI